MTFFFWCKFGFGKSFGISSQSNHWAGHHWLYKIYFTSHIWSRNGSLLLHRKRENDTTKCRLLKFSVGSWVTHLSSFFTFLIYFKCHTTVEWSMLSSSATSHVVVRGSASNMALSSSFSNFKWPASMLFIFKALISFTKLF